MQAELEQRAAKLEEAAAKAAADTRKHTHSLQAQILQLEAELTKARQEAAAQLAGKQPELSGATQADTVRELMAQLAETRLAAGAESEKRRALEVQLARTEQKAMTAEGLAREERNQAGLVESLRRELKMQEAEVREARKLQEHMRYVILLPPTTGAKHWAC